MNNSDYVAVCSRSFSSNDLLRAELIAKYKNIKFNDAGIQLSGQELIDFLSGCNKAIVGLEVLNESILNSLPELNVVSKYGVGLDGLDLEAMKNRNIRLGWTRGVNRRSVSELTLALSLITLRNIGLSNTIVNKGNWRQIKGHLLSGKTVGIVGFGCVGSDFASLLKPFDCTILINDILQISKNENVQQVQLDDLLVRSDLVSLHVPLNESTKNLLSKNRLARMKTGSVLINTARGGVVDEIALLNLLKNGSIAAAGFDVFEVEPPLNNDLLSLENFYATSHIGGSANEAILNMGRSAIIGLEENKTPDIG